MWIIYPQLQTSWRLSLGKFLKIRQPEVPVVSGIPLQPKLCNAAATPRSPGAVARCIQALCQTAPSQRMTEWKPPSSNSLPQARLPTITSGCPVLPPNLAFHTGRATPGPYGTQGWPGATRSCRGLLHITANIRPLPAFGGFLHSRCARFLTAAYRQTASPGCVKHFLGAVTQKKKKLQNLSHSNICFKGRSESFTIAMTLQERCETQCLSTSSTLQREMDIRAHFAT